MSCHGADAVPPLSTGMVYAGGFLQQRRPGIQGVEFPALVPALFQQLSGLEEDRERPDVLVSTAIREIREETGLEVRDTDTVRVVNDISGRYLYPTLFEPEIQSFFTNRRPEIPLCPNLR